MRRKRGLPDWGEQTGESMSGEPALKVESREELVYLLSEASEIEHGLMCEYLYAQFSLKRTAEEGLTDDQLARVKAWEQTLIAIIKQEMLHLALATNILTAIGAAPHFDRPNFPILARWYPPEVQIELLPFGEQALRHFMYLERPEGMNLADAEGFSPSRLIETALGEDDHVVVAAPEEWQTVGHLYRGIEAGLAHLCDRYGEDAVFIGPASAQAVTDIFEWKELIAVTDLASASQAIEVIVEQGEGARGDWVKSHFGMFVGVLEDLLALQAADASFVPARPVEPAYVRLPPDVASGALIEDPLTARVAELCIGLYELILQAQSRYYVHQDETPAELDTLARTAKHLMNWVLRPLGSVLTALPIGPTFPGRTAGPPFEIVRPSFFVLPHREAAWKVIAERLDVLSETCALLAKEPGLAVLGDLAGKLTAMADEFRTHLAERAHS